MESGRVDGHTDQISLSKLDTATDDERIVYMPITGFDLSEFRPSHTCRGYFALISLLCAVVCVSCSGAAAQSDQVVARHMKGFFEAWLRRELRGNELREVTDEFIALYARRGKDRAGIHEAAKSFDLYTKLLREHDGTPGALTTRHFLLALNYFAPEMQNTIELRLLNEPDPVRVVDPGYKRLMTEKDVVALANIYNFANSDGEPRHKDLSRQVIDRLVVELDRAYGNYPKATEMPQFYGETAAFWAGVRQQWPHLNAEEKRQARAYAQNTYKARMPVPLYAKLFGLDDNAAASRYLDDVNAVMVYINQVNMQNTVLDVLRNQVRTW
jgi:hypothetical protein